MENKLLTPQQVADYMQVDFRTVYNLLRRGKLKGIKVGRVWRIAPEDLEHFLNISNKVKGGTLK